LALICPLDISATLVCIYDDEIQTLEYLAALRHLKNFGTLYTDRLSVLAVLAAFYDRIPATRHNIYKVSRF
jgi:hypothetical protein